MSSDRHSRGCIASRSRTGEEHLLLFFLDARLRPDQVNPGLRLLRCRRLEVEIPTGREKAKDILALLFRIFEEGDGGKVGEVDLVAELVFFVGFVYRETIRSEDEVDGLPGLGASVSTGFKWKCDSQANLGLSCSSQKRSALEDAIDFEAAVLVDRGCGHVETVGVVRGELGCSSAAGHIASPLDLDLCHCGGRRRLCSAVV